MNRETLAALKGSIKKWEKIVAGTECDRGQYNCPLCALFFWAKCRGCPVDDKSNDGCAGTPYDQWIDLFQVTDFRDGKVLANNADRKAAAKRELEFLKGLLPKESL